MTLKEAETQLNEVEHQLNKCNLVNLDFTGTTWSLSSAVNLALLTNSIEDLSTAVETFEKLKTTSKSARSEKTQQMNKLIPSHQGFNQFS
jgi:predicted deacetylase